MALNRAVALRMAYLTGNSIDARFRRESESTCSTACIPCSASLRLHFCVVLLSNVHVVRLNYRRRCRPFPKHQMRINARQRVISRETVRTNGQQKYERHISRPPHRHPLSLSLSGVRTTAATAVKSARPPPTTGLDLHANQHCTKTRTHTEKKTAHAHLCGAEHGAARIRIRIFGDNGAVRTIKPRHNRVCFFVVVVVVFGSVQPSQTPNQRAYTTKNNTNQKPARTGCNARNIQKKTHTHWHTCGPAIELMVSDENTIRQLSLKSGDKIYFICGHGRSGGGEAISESAPNANGHTQLNCAR